MGPIGQAPLTPAAADPYENIHWATAPIGAKYCYRVLTHYEAPGLLKEIPDCLKEGELCEYFQYKAEAAARCWKRPYPEEMLMGLVPLGSVKKYGKFDVENYPRVLNVERVVTDSDNVKQDLSIDVYGRTEDGEEVEEDAHIRNGAKRTDDGVSGVRRVALAADGVPSSDCRKLPADAKLASPASRAPRPSPRSASARPAGARRAAPLASAGRAAAAEPAEPPNATPNFSFATHAAAATEARSAAPAAKGGRCRSCVVQARRARMERGDGSQASQSQPSKLSQPSTRATVVGNKFA